MMNDGLARPVVIRVRRRLLSRFASATPVPLDLCVEHAHDTDVADAPSYAAGAAAGGAATTSISRAFRARARTALPFRSAGHPRR